MADNMEMSTINNELPRWYKGYDMDILLTKLGHDEPLTEEEDSIVDEAIYIYYNIYSQQKHNEHKKFNGKDLAAGTRVTPNYNMHLEVKGRGGLSKC